MTSNQLEVKFLEFTKQMANYNEALSLMFWDLRTGAPKKGVEQRSEAIGTISSEIFKMSTSEQMKEFIDGLSNVEDVSEITRKSIAECQEEYERNKKIPLEEYRDYVVLQSKAESVWEEAKEKSDFVMFQPYLENLVSYNKRFIEYWGYEGNKYNSLLDQYEPGVKVEEIDQVFGQLRDRIVPLVKEITERGAKIETDFLFKYFPKDKQKEFSLEVLKELGYDFNAGRLDETIHPFAIGLNPGDVRITTKFDENDFRTAIFGTIHECGHAIYEQNISKNLIGTPLCTGTSMGIHESQSLFFENFIGRNENFWVKNYHLLKKYAGKQFNSIPLNKFYRAINEAKPSLIRIEADELTYPLHIMVRYEIEKGLFNDELEVSELPQIWNEKMMEYIGVKPKNDAEGILQDVHWAGGDFGYFPSYALGYIYAAQFKHALAKDMQFEKYLQSGNLKPIKKWLMEKVHQHGKLKKPLEILYDVTGEGLNANYLIDYLEKKYRSVYCLN